MNSIKFSSPGTTQIAKFSKYGFFSVSGPDASKFLQGQLTCDVAKLSVGESSHGAQCNPKGRIISSFLITRTSEQSFLFRVRSGAVETAKSSLNKYMVFSKAQIHDEAQLQCFALSGEKISIRIQESLASIPEIFVFTFGEHYCELIATEAHLNTQTHILKDFELAPEESLEHMQIQYGIAEISTQNSERYLPQELNYDQIGAVSFKKGCYTGQEVIARLHYKGKLKKRLRLGKHEGSKLITNGKIFDASTQKACGEVINTSTFDQKCSYCLALIDDQSVESDSCVTAIQNGAKIQWMELPYAITK